MRKKSKKSIGVRLKRLALAAVAVLAILSAPAAVSASQPSDQSTEIEAQKKEAPKVFIDCSDCDHDYIRTEITFVNYVRDRLEAGVHVLVTTQRTGSGGWEYTLTFIGQGPFAGMDDVHKFYTGKMDSRDQVRSQLVRALKLGLTRYAARTPIAGRLRLDFHRETAAGPKKDPWKSWAFSLGASGFFNGEQSYRSDSLAANFSANRVTADWKLYVALAASGSHSAYTYEGEKIVGDSRSRSARSMAVKSLGEHWSVGAYLSAATSTYSNQRLLLSLAPAVEYNVFRYSQSSRRQLRLLYKAGWQGTRYFEETTSDKMRDSLFYHSLEAAFDLKEKWGSVSTLLSGSQYLHDVSKNRIRLSGEISLNLLKGLSVNVYGGGAWIHDQISLVKRDANLEELLLGLRQMATTYSFNVGVGLRYTFGSIYTNVVNSRFGSGDGYSISISM